ncbi:putative MFS multidrug transporter [Aspergillus foveolatus]|uniref:putative MFS multidrug transporter n=1 Tax=Aspergillus foveolatus TaxID=210207 RepID=UPI003CCCB109
MVFYLLYKHTKKSRAAKRQSHSIPLRPFDGQHDSDSLNPPNTSARHEKSISHEAEAEKRRRRVYRLKLVCALFMPYFLATIDLTIVATSVPFIASHFNELSELNWIVTAFTLTSTALIPSFGQLSDVFGRHVTLQLATFLMLVGSVLGAAAQTWGMLLLGRALQGVGSAGLMSTVMIILADNVTLEENAKNNSIFSFVSGVAYAVGPVIGGYLTDANWRYCFVISIPIAFLSHIIVYVVLRNDLKQGTHFRRGSRLSSFLPALATIDIVGTILFIFGVGLIILGTAWGGSTYPWVSAEVLAPLVVGGACFAMFFVYEYFLENGEFGRIFPAQKPMLPYSMFKKIDTLWLAVLQFAAGAAMYSVFYYVGIYFTVVEAYSASKAGVQLLYYIPGLGAGVYLAILLCNTYPAQTFPPLLFGTVAETVGLGMMIYAIRTEQSNILNGMMVLAGAGTGIRLMPASLHASGVWPDRIASALSLLRFALPFGGTLGITIMGSVFNNKLAEGVASIQGYGSGNVSAQDFTHGGTSSLSFINSLPADEQAKVRTSGRDAIMWAYAAILPIIGISVLTTLLMGNVWIKKRKNRTAAVEQGMSETETGSGESEVVFVPYLYALAKGVNKYKYITRPFLDSNPTEASGRQETQ